MSADTARAVREQMDVVEAPLLLYRTNKPTGFDCPGCAWPDKEHTSTYDPKQFPSVRGELERLTLTGRGDIDGLILKDGTEVKTSPDLSTQIAFAIRPGDRVTIHGMRAAALPLVRAVSITDDVTHRTVTDSDVSTPMNPRQCDLRRSGRRPAPAPK
jgi:hypothetical protein